MSTQNSTIRTYPNKQGAISFINMNFNFIAFDGERETAIKNLEQHGIAKIGGVIVIVDEFGILN